MCRSASTAAAACSRRDGRAPKARSRKPWPEARSRTTGEELGKDALGSRQADALGPKGINVVAAHRRVLSCALTPTRHLNCAALAADSLPGDIPRREESAHETGGF